MEIVKTLVRVLAVFSFCIGIFYLGKTESYRLLKLGGNIPLKDELETLNHTELVGGGIGVALGAILYVITFFVTGSVQIKNSIYD